MSGRDPLGRMPGKGTGDLNEDYCDETRQQHVEEADKAFKDIWVDDYPPQVAIRARVRAYMKKTDGIRGRSIKGLRLGEEWHSGKSSNIENLRLALMREQRAAGLEVNEYEILIITIEEEISLKAFYQEILRQMGDDYFDEEAKRGPKRDERTMKLLETKIANWAIKLGVRLLVADEIQRLSHGGRNTKAVIERLHTFVDRGVVPLLLIGNGRTKAFFKANKDLAVRFGRPLKLEPMKTKGSAIEAGHFQAFLRSFDDQLVSTGIFTIRSGLSTQAMLDPIVEVTGCHIGRVARLIEEAYPVAIRRGAASIEMRDLSIVTREFAIDLGWIKTDPFSTPYRK